MISKKNDLLAFMSFTIMILAIGSLIGFYHFSGNHKDKYETERMYRKIDTVIAVDKFRMMHAELESALMFSTLKEFRNKYPTRWPKKDETFNGRQLGEWCNNYKLTHWTDSKFSMLKKIGFPIDESRATKEKVRAYKAMDLTSQIFSKEEGVQ